MKHVSKHAICMYICLSAVGQVNLEIVGIAQQESAGQPMHSVNLLMTNETCLSGTNTAKMDRVLLEVTAAACVCWQIPASAYCQAAYCQLANQCSQLQA